MNPPPQSPLQIILEPCQSGLTYLFAKEAGASNPLGSSNLPGSAKIGNRNQKPKWGRREAPTQTHSRQEFPNSKGFSTLRVAQKRRFDP